MKVLSFFQNIADLLRKVNSLSADIIEIYRTQSKPVSNTDYTE